MNGCKTKVRRKLWRGEQDIFGTEKVNPLPATEQAMVEETDPISPAEPGKFDEIDPLYLQTDVEGLISIQTPDDVAALRQKLINLLWGVGGLPMRLPDAVQVLDDNEDVTGVETVERFVIKMDYGLESVAYHYIPENENGKLVIWHEGHYDFVHFEYVQQFIDQGYAVLTYCMPLFCENTHPVVSVPRLGLIRLDYHDYMALLEPKAGHPLKYFLEPIVVGLNYLQQEVDYNHIAMVGYSGGGWSTTMAAALDPRILSSFPTAGSYPIFLREYRDRADYEHQIPEVYTLTNFLELYVMGAYGEDRMQMQIINQYDPCCYAGNKGQVYADDVGNRVAQLGAGNWTLSIDPYTEHDISPQSMDKIFDYLVGK